jgi:hypothetical protein
VFDVTASVAALVMVPTLVLPTMELSPALLDVEMLFESIALLQIALYLDVAPRNILPLNVFPEITQFVTVNDNSPSRELPEKTPPCPESIVEVAPKPRLPDTVKKNDCVIPEPMMEAKDSDETSAEHPTTDGLWHEPIVIIIMTDVLPYTEMLRTVLLVLKNDLTN